MERFLSRRDVTLLCSFMAGLFLILHVIMFVVFLLCGVTPMAVFNAFSILFYIVMLVLIHRQKLTWFVILTFLEILAHMGFAVYFTGLAVGFQITIIGICTVLYYAEYVGRSMRIKTLKSRWFLLAAMAEYILIFVVRFLSPAPYVLPRRVAFLFHIGWAVIVFVILGFILEIFVMVSTKSQELLSDEVTHDRLTGLPNRYYMTAFFQKLPETAAKDEYWAAIADLDSFKQINDIYGHNCGDYVLKSFAAILTARFSYLEFCRWGGEEFLLVGKTAECDPKEHLEKIRRAVELCPFTWEGSHLDLTVTIGAAMYDPSRSVEEWIDAADKKLYEGKQSGKNRVIL